MEHDFGSECSSAGESGWTLYLGHSIHPSDFNQDDEDEDDDMSMVSDASSGPPHLQQHQECKNNGLSAWTTQNNMVLTQPTSPCFVDETASSPFFNFSSYVADYQASVEEDDDVIADHPHGYFQPKSTFQDQLQQNQLYEGKRWG